MALEEQIAALVEAVKENTASLNASVKARNEALASLSKADEGKPVAAKVTKPAAAKKVDAAPETASEPTDDYAPLRELVAAYFAVERPEERAARQEKVQALLNHPKIKKAGVPDDAKPDLRNIEQASIPLFRKQLALLEEKGDLTTPEDTASDDESLI